MNTATMDGKPYMPYTQQSVPPSAIPTVDHGITPQGYMQNTMHQSQLPVPQPYGQLQSYSCGSAYPQSFPCGPISPQNFSSGAVHHSNFACGPMTSQNFHSASMSPQNYTSGPLSQNYFSGPIPPQNFPNGPTSHQNFSNGPFSPQNFSCGPFSPQSFTSGLIPPPQSFPSIPISDQLLDIELRLTQKLLQLNYGDKVTHIYNPLDYAIEPHKNFVKKFCTSRKDILFLGMNPGPFGMAQTGVPFGEATLVRDWLQISGHVGKPETEHPKRPVWGLDCPRSEVSGARFWGFLQETCKTPEQFFRHCFVYNMCPLVFMNATGKNLTPPDFLVAVRRPLNDLCDQALCEVIKLLNVRLIVGIGKYAQERALTALKNAGIQAVQVHCIMHPSPANPAANKGWSNIVEKQLMDIGIMGLLKP